MRAIWRISEAALAPDRFPAALQSINEAVGASGGNYLFLNKRFGDIEWVSSTGLNVDVNHYVNYYAARDPYRPILETASRGSWVQVPKCLPETFLCRDEWYNDFLLKAGIRDVAGARLFETASHTVIFGVMHGIYQAPPSAVGAVRLQEPCEKVGVSRQAELIRVLANIPVIPLSLPEQE
jgi:hypothetical protein